MIPKQVTDFMKEMADDMCRHMEEERSFPWEWQSGLFGFGQAMRHKAGKQYKGINQPWLSSHSKGFNEWLTFNGVKSLGGHVKKRPKDHQGYWGLPIIKFWWEVFTEVDKKTGEEKKRVKPRWRFYTVFEIGDTVEGIDPKFNIPRDENDAPEEIPDIEAFIKTIIEKTGLTWTARKGTPAYRPSTHELLIPPREYFKSQERYYESVLHELTHSTGKALKRDLGGGFGSEKYSAEEVIAEFGTTALLNFFGIVREKEDAKNMEAYILSWSKKFKEHPEWLFFGVQKAEKAVQYLLETAGLIAPEEAEEKETAD